MSLIKLIYKLNVYKITAISFVVVNCISCTSFQDASNGDDFKKRLDKLLNTSLSNNDLLLLQKTEQLGLAFKKISENKYDKAKEISLDILFEVNLSVSIYKYALKAYTLSLILNDSLYPKKNNIIKNFDFNIFQNMQCAQLCDSPGWKTLAKYDSFIFSLTGYNDILLSEDIFALIKHEKPILAIDPIFLGNQTNELKKISYSNSGEFFSSDEVDEKVALSYFLHGEFGKSIEILNKLSLKSNDIAFKSFCYYWIGRSYSALNNNSDAKKYYLLAGNENPLGLYDALSGQMLKNLSGRASTHDLSPFINSWEEEKNKWIKFPAFKMKDGEVITSLKHAILTLSKIKLSHNFSSIEQLQKYLKLEQSLENFVVRDEINWLTKTWEQQFAFFAKEDRPDIISNNITWLNYVTGNYLQAILLISKIKQTLDPLYEFNNFLYFLFYPQFYKDQMLVANKKCHVDPDLMYAIFRQEGFFQDKEISNEDATQKVCNIKNIMEKYRNNIVNTLSAYRAGSDLTDIWLNDNVKINDDPIFMEYIPDNKIKEFVQGVMKNYYNFKWIYYNKN